ncbi:MAG: C25 family cysteine peptidase [Bacteroidota bacterium]
MKTKIIFVLLIIHAPWLFAGTIVKTFYFGHPKIESRGVYQAVCFDSTLQCGIPGEPLLPWHEVVLMLPPGEAAGAIQVIYENETPVPGQYLIQPRQHVRPTAEDKPGEFLLNARVYRRHGVYKVPASGQLLTQYLNGFALALSSFTPVRYNPGDKRLSYYKKVTVTITTSPDARSAEALTRLSASENVVSRVKSFVMNPGMVARYPARRSPLSNYQYLIISPSSFKDEFQQLTAMYAAKGISTRIVTVDSISACGTGYDLAEKIRNFVIGQYQLYGIEYLLLAGNPPLIPARGFYCQVYSGGSVYVDANIPADLYYSALDGNFDLNGNHIYAEVTDAPDLLPDIAVGRFTVNDTAELHHMIHKSVSYQTNPVIGEANKPLLAGEYLWAAPLTFGGSYLDLLVNNRSDNGYFTCGIPAATNVIRRLYDTLISPPYNIWQWIPAMLLEKINQGNSFIHHLGHANTSYMMRLSYDQITNSNFQGVDGIAHNYQLCYTQGCDCGAFDNGCIAAKAVTIDNFLAAGIFNSRYGWFDEGTTEGPSEHLEREFVSAIYNDTLPEKHIGAAHMISKIKTAPWVGLPGEFEPGAQRWCQYDCNLFGDPAMEIWTTEPATFSSATWTGSVDSNWNDPGNWNPPVVPTTLTDLTIPAAPHLPVITTVNRTFGHNVTIQPGGNLTINKGKSMVIYGTVTLAP